MTSTFEPIGPCQLCSTWITGIYHTSGPCPTLSGDESWLPLQTQINHLRERIEVLEAKQ